jgi:imidazolonepropionase-like amidohydrolase
MVADRLAAARIPVILDPTDNLPDSFESLGATMENASRLAAADVTVAFKTDATHNASNSRHLAGNAVAHGLPYEEGLAAVTLNPALIYGLGDEAGSIEPGKAADVVVWDGDPLEVTTYADQVVIGGRIIPMVSRSTLLRDRYLELDGPLPPAFAN